MKILVPVEDIFFGLAIVNFLAQHQWPEQVEFRIVNVIEQFLLDDSSQVAFSKFLTNSKQDIIDSAGSLVENVAQAMRAKFPKALVSHEVFIGHVKEEVLALAQYWPADLIVAGSHGRSGFNNILLGSISLTFVSAAPCPVVLVKPNATVLKIYDKVDSRSTSMELAAKVAAAAQTQRILIAVDETDISKQIIDFIIKHSWMEPAHFKIVSVAKELSWEQILPPPILAEIRNESIGRSRSLVRNLSLKLKDILHSEHIEEEVLEGDPKVVIVEMIKQWKADLVIVGYHSKNTLQKMLPGSVSLSILSTAPCSVMLLREDEKNSSLETRLSASVEKV